MQLPLLPAARRPVLVNIRFTQRSSGLLWSCAVAKTVCCAMLGTPLTLTVSSGNGKSGLGKAPISHTSTLYPALPLVSVMRPRFSLRQSSAVSSGRR